MADYEIKDIYQGGYSSFKSNYGDSFIGYHIPAGSLGITTDPRVADVLTEVNQKMAPGGKIIELALIQPEIFDSIPKQHLKEINRLAKLTGVDVTVHGPLIEPSGITKEGYSNSNREAAERQMLMAVERASEINPDGSSPVTFHSSAILPGKEITKTKDGEKVTGMLIINSESGSINQIKLKERFFPGETDVSIEKELGKANEDAWSQQLTHLSYSTERASDFIRQSGALAILAEAEKKLGKQLEPVKENAIQSFNIGKNYLNDSYRELKEMCDIAYKNSSPENKDILKSLYNEIETKAEQIKKDPKSSESVTLRQEIIKEGIETLGRIPIPQIYKPLDEFSREKTATTFGDVAFDAYKKFKDKTPIICIENPPIGTAFSRAEDLKGIVETARDKFVERAVKEGMSENEAEKQAEKLIGVTWDVGHINMLRKHGFNEEDIVKETEKVAKFVKHVHLSDNFGFEHTELPMGMGNVPIKDIMNKLGEAGYEGKKIIEAANWWQHFKTSPVGESLKAMGSPIYSMQMGPYWNQYLGLHQGYFSGYGEMLPSVNYSTWGAGFSQLPMEIGGQMPGQQGSRFSGKGME
ncbi:MAG: TIM barrel protein [archaeon]|nr:TIM barrel protein [archaeon]